MDTVHAHLFNDLCPEELYPRLELQVFIDPMGGLTQAASENCCRDGGNCTLACDNTCRDGGNCSIEIAVQAQISKSL